VPMRAYFGANARLLWCQCAYFGANAPTLVPMRLLWCQCAYFGANAYFFQILTYFRD